MISKAETIEPSKLEWIKVYINDKHYAERDAGKILTELDGDFLIGGPIFLWDKTTKNPMLPKGPCCHLKSDGNVLCNPGYTVPVGAPAWNTPADYGISIPFPCDKLNYIQCVPLIRNGVAVTPLKVNPDMNGKSCRMVIGGKQGRVGYYTSTEKLTPLELQAVLLSYGWEWAEMLDGGGSVIYVNKDGGALRCDSGRVLYSYIVFRLKRATTPPTGNEIKRNKVLSIASSQIGVKESPSGSNLQKYGEWYGLNGYAWCMMFVQWVFSHADLPLPLRTASCTELANYAKVHGQWVTKGYKPGDIVFMHFKQSTTATEHVGIIESVSSTYITTIEGNTSLTSQDNGGAVMRRNRANSVITGAYRPWYNV